jgi:hypothetical protein
VSRSGTALGALGVVVLAAAAAYAASRADIRGGGESLNPSPPVGRVRVEVLNAGGVPGQARAATDVLRDVGFDVVQFGNADTFDRDSSRVLDRVGRPELARAVARALGVREVAIEPDPNLFVDVTVLLGRDWQAGDALDPTQGDRPEREVWDPRGWIGR